MEPDDSNLPESLKIAYEKGMAVLFVPKKEKAEHPNMVHLKLIRGDNQWSVTAISMCGGNIQISELNGVKITLSLGVHMLVVVQEDTPGVVAKVSQFLYEQNENIGTMSVARESKGKKAMMIIEVDERDEKILEKIRQLDAVYNASYFG